MITEARMPVKFAVKIGISNLFRTTDTRRKRLLVEVEGVTDSKVLKCYLSAGLRNDSCGSHGDLGTAWRKADGKNREILSAPL